MVDQNGKLVVKYKYDAYCNNNLVMYVNPTGDIAFLALVIGKNIGACIDFGTALILFLKMDQYLMMMLNGMIILEQQQVLRLLLN